MAAIFEPLTKPLSLDLKVTGKTSATVREIIIEADTSSENYTTPKRITIYVGRRDSKNHKSTLRKMEMDPNGKLALRFSPQRMRWIFIRINDVWDAGKPVRIDRIRIR